jgi:hypothetical protein
MAKSPVHPTILPLVCLQVAELKKELGKLGEPTDGLKAVLVARLEKVIADTP